MIAAAGGGVAFGGSVVAAAAGWTSPTGLAAFVTALVGAGALVWSIYQAGHRHKEIDVETALELIEAAAKKKRDLE